MVEKYYRAAKYHHGSVRKTERFISKAAGTSKLFHENSWNRAGSRHTTRAYYEEKCEIGSLGHNGPESGETQVGLPSTLRGRRST